MADIGRYSDDQESYILTDEEEKKDKAKAAEMSEYDDEEEADEEEEEEGELETETEIEDPLDKSSQLLIKVAESVAKLKKGDKNSQLLSDMLMTLTEM